MDFVTKQRSAFWLIIILILLNCTTLFFLWFRPDFRPRPGMHHSFPKDRPFMEELKLTQEQKNQFEEYRHGYFEMVKNYTDKINSKKYELMGILFTKEPNRQQLNLLAEELGQLNSQFEKARFEKILNFKAILTEEQFGLFKGIVDEAYKPGPGKMGKNGPPPDFGEGQPRTMPPRDANRPPREVPPPPPNKY